MDGITDRDICDAWDQSVRINNPYKRPSWQGVQHAQLVAATERQTNVLAGPAKAMVESQSRLAECLERVADGLDLIERRLADLGQAAGGACDCYTEYMGEGDDDSVNR